MLWSVPLAAAVPVALALAYAIALAFALVFALALVLALFGLAIALALALAFALICFLVCETVPEEAFAGAVVTLRSAPSSSMSSCSCRKDCTFFCFGRSGRGGDGGGIREKRKQKITIRTMKMQGYFGVQSVDTQKLFLPLLT